MSDEVILSAEKSAALNHYLSFLSEWLTDPTISNVHINEPKKIFFKQFGEKKVAEVSELTVDFLIGLSQLVATYTQQRLSSEEPLLSAILPQGHRVQIVLSPTSATLKDGSPTLAFRQQVIQDLSLEILQGKGVFDAIESHKIENFNLMPRTLNKEEKALSVLFEKGEYLTFLQEAILAKKNIIISGATDSGKTTLLNACLKTIPLYERIITLEDTRELQLPHEDKAHLVASKNDQGLAKVTMSQLVEVCLRLSPDRIIFGEMRGAEALDFVNASLTGHEGSLVSMHATNPTAAFVRLSNMIQSNPHAQLSRQDILTDLHLLIDVVVQMKKIATPEGDRRMVTEMYSAFNF